MKKIPYGIADFERIIRQDYYYIDKSEYIRTVEEQDSYVLLVRPRRMGKSLFSNMLMTYYDINTKDQFLDYFGNLKIGLNPTEWANKFVVISLDFSQVGGDAETLEHDFTQYCFIKLQKFFEDYQNIFTEKERESVLSLGSVKHAFVRLNDLAKAKGLHTYLFIDEIKNVYT